MKLVTIITEGLLKDQIVSLLKQHQVTGYTVSRTDGEGSRGVQASHWEGPNMKLETITTPQVADAIIDGIAEKYFDHYSVVAWLSDVSVLRGEKFAPEKS